MGGPLAELGCSNRIDAIANRDDGIEVVETGVVIFTISGSCSEFPNN